MGAMLSKDNALTYGATACTGFAVWLLAAPESMYSMYFNGTPSDEVIYDLQIIGSQMAFTSVIAWYGRSMESDAQRKICRAAAVSNILSTSLHFKNLDRFQDGVGAFNVAFGVFNSIYFAYLGMN
jgi:hypothetical protein